MKREFYPVLRDYAFAHFPVEKALLLVQATAFMNEHVASKFDELVSTIYETEFEIPSLVHVELYKILFPLGFTPWMVGEFVRESREKALALKNDPETKEKMKSWVVLIGWEMYKVLEIVAARLEAAGLFFHVELRKGIKVPKGMRSIEIRPLNLVNGIDPQEIFTKVLREGFVEYLKLKDSTRSIDISNEVVRNQIREVIREKIRELLGE